MKKGILLPLLGLCFIAVSAFVLQPKQVTVYLVGDSTMCLYTPREFPFTGWGMPFADYFDQTVVVDNRAKGGRSTKSYIAENSWQPIVDRLQAGDYVLIQFGHNDEGKRPERHTTVPEFKINLAKFITETRQKQAIPVLITPVGRWLFDDNGNIRETHKNYRAAVIEIGAQYQVPVIDLDQKSQQLYQQLGQAKSHRLFMNLDSAEHPNYPLGRGDSTHFNEYGARKIAELVIREIKEQHLPLADYIHKGLYPIKGSIVKK